MAEEVAKTVTKEVQRAIIQDDLTLWLNTRFQMQMRYRVQKSLEKFGDVSQPLKVIEAELIKCEAAIEMLTKMLAELEEESHEKNPQGR